MAFNDNNSNDYWNYNNSSTNTQFGGEAVYNPNPFVTHEIDISSENKLLSKVFTWMGVGLGVSAISALLGFQFLQSYVSIAYIPLIIVELVLVLALTFGLKKMNAVVAGICFMAYAVVNGLTLTSIFLVYEIQSIYSTFLITAVVFGTAAVYGRFTKKDLTSWGTYLLMALVGIIVAGIVNIFLHNQMLDFGIAVLGVIIFVGLTAYDVNKIKEMAMAEGLENSESYRKLAIIGALNLYLDFINLFLKLLRLLGNRRR